MNPDPIKVAEYLHLWMSAEIVDTTKRYHEVAKFCFSMSSATLAAVVAGVKIADQTKFEAWSLVSVLAIFVSFLPCVALLYPREWRVSADSNIEDELDKSIGRSQRWFLAWTALWIAGAATGIVAIFAT